MQSTKTMQKRKSARLTPDELRKLKSTVKNKTVSEVADEMKIPRYVLDRFLLVGSGSPANTAIIRENLGEVA